MQRLKNKSYKPQASLCIQIPKENGKTRPLGIAVYEDKLVQLALKKIMEAIYEPRFLECMHGYRPNKGCHTAIKALNQSIEKKYTGWIFDADVKGYFDNLNHEWIMKTVGVHIKDPNILGSIKKFLKAGIMEENVYYNTGEKATQGSNLSPLIANIYMHYMLTLWFYKVFNPKCRGYSAITVYADDFMGCFQYRSDAEMFCLLKERLEMFGLELEPSKIREDK